jgi:hypothetical protein
MVVWYIYGYLAYFVGSHLDYFFHLVRSNEKNLATLIPTYLLYVKVSKRFCSHCHRLGTLSAFFLFLRHSLEFDLHFGNTSEVRH